MLSLDEVRTWQCRSLSAVYPLVWMDAIVVKVRENGRVINKAIHLVLAVNLQGEKELLGMWMSQSEGCQVLDERADRTQRIGAFRTSLLPVWMG